MCVCVCVQSGVDRSEKNEKENEKGEKRGTSTQGSQMRDERSNT